MLRSALQSSTAAQPVCWISKTPRYQLHHCTTPLRQHRIRLSKCFSARSRRLQHLVPDPEADAVAADVLPDLLLDLGVAEDVAAAANPGIFESSPRRLPAVYSSSGHTDPAAADGSTDWTASDDVDIFAASKHLSAAAVNNKQQPQNLLLQPVVSSLLESAPQAGQQQAGQQQALAGAPYASSSSSSSEGGSGPAARAVSWKSAAADAAAAVDIGTPTRSAAHAEVAHGSQHAAGAEPPPPAPAAAAANSGAGDTAAGGFFSSRASMLQQLRQQQVQVQRTHVMKQHSQQLYRYTVADGDDDSSRIKRQPPSTPISPIKQTTFPLAKQQPPTHTTASSSSSSSSSSSQGSVAGLQQTAAGGLHAAAAQDDQEQPWIDNQQQQLLQQQQQQQQQGGGPSPPLPSYLQPQHQQHHNAAATETQQQELTDSAIPSRHSVSSSGVTALPLAATRTPPHDLSRGLCLSAFLYCCSRTQLLSLTWQLGLPPSALRIVSRVADADMVLHVKPGPGVRHYDYETYRSQAAAKGIPFIDLKSLSLLELQLYLLPVFRLYAGELSPRDLLLRKKRRGYKTRYTNIKLPPA